MSVSLCATGVTVLAESEEKQLLTSDWEGRSGVCGKDGRGRLGSMTLGRSEGIKGVECKSDSMCRMLPERSETEYLA